jgi:hypothetical protein
MSARRACPAIEGVKGGINPKTDILGRSVRRAGGCIESLVVNCSNSPTNSYIYQKIFDEKEI